MSNRKAVIESNTYSTLGPRAETYMDWLEAYEKMIEETEYDAEQEGYNPDSAVCNMLRAKMEDVTTPGRYSEGPILEARLKALNTLLANPKYKTCGEKIRNAVGKIRKYAIGYGGRTKRSKRSKRSKSRRTRRTRR